MAARFGEFSAAAAAGCDRMVHPSVLPGERKVHSRFIALMLSAPFLIAGATVALLTAKLGPSATATAIFGIFGVCWLSALIVAVSGRLQLATILSLSLVSALLTVLTTVSGGLASPIAALAVAIPLEARWAGASRRVVAAAGGAALCGLALLVLFGGALSLEAASPAAWHWLFPLAWCAVWLPRVTTDGDSSPVAVKVTEGEQLADLTQGVPLRLSRHGDVVEASLLARDILNLAPELILGTGLFDRIHLSDRIGYLSALADLREGAGRRSLELRIRLPRSADSPADNYVPFRLEMMVGSDEDNFIALLRNNEATATLKADLALARETAASADMAKSRFLAAVSHELRTPLNAIIGFSDMMLLEMFGPFGDARQKEYVGLIRDSGQHLLSVVTSILDVSKIESGAYATQPEPFRFVEAVEMCHSMMKLQASAKSIDLRLQIAADAGEINADRRAVQQMLINLTSNAVKFTPDGGHVVIGAKKVGSRLHFWVQDNGIGIAEHDLEKLGKPFMQIQNDYTRCFEGTGLGLALVKGLVALHDGTMSIESALGAGTTVTISLPVDGPATKEAKAGVLALPSTKRRKEDSHGSLRKTA